MTGDIKLFTIATSGCIRTRVKKQMEGERVSDAENSPQKRVTIGVWEKLRVSYLPVVVTALKVIYQGLRHVMDEKRIAELREFSKDFQRGTLLTGVKLRIAEAAIHELLDEVERYKYAIYRLSQWTYAYPLVPFPEPDFEKAKEILEANGMTLDRISASNMRHVLSGVKNIIAGLDVQ